MTNECVLVKDKDKIKKVFIYEIFPITFLNFSIDIQSNILNLYSEFLREMNFNFQIFISNKRINTNNYMLNIKRNINYENNDKYVELLEAYLEHVYNELKDENIYTTKFYLILAFDGEEDYDIKSIDSVIQKLDAIGCKTNRIQNMNTLKLILYECINKEVVI